MPYGGPHEALCAMALPNASQKAGNCTCLIGALRERPEGPDEGISRSRDCRETLSTAHRFAGATRTERSDISLAARAGRPQKSPHEPQDRRKTPHPTAGTKMLRRVLLALVAGAAALSAPKARAPIKAAPAAIAAAAALAPAAALADVSFVEEVEGVALGLLPLAGIAAIVGGGAIAKLGPSLEKAAKMKRTLALEYSAQKRFLKKDMDVKA